MSSVLRRVAAECHQQQLRAGLQQKLDRIDKWLMNFVSEFGPIPLVEMFAIARGDGGDRSIRPLLYVSVDEIVARIEASDKFEVSDDAVISLRPKHSDLAG